MHYQDCLADIQSVETAYFTPGGGAPHLAARSVIAIYEDADCDGDPTTGPPALLFSVVTVSMNHGANILNSTPTGTVPIGSACSWVMATWPQIAGESPAPMDTTNPTPNAWITGQTPTGASLDISDINNNYVPPLQAKRSVSQPRGCCVRPGTRTQGSSIPSHASARPVALAPTTGTAWVAARTVSRGARPSRAPARP